MTIRIGDSCTACGACLVTCPTAALTPAIRRPAVDDGRCTDCLACIEVCPADAIRLVPTEVGRAPVPQGARSPDQCGTGHRSMPMATNRPLPASLDRRSTAAAGAGAGAAASTGPRRRS